MPPDNTNKATFLGVWISGTRRQDIEKMDESLLFHGEEATRNHPNKDPQENTKWMVTPLRYANNVRVSERYVKIYLLW